MIINLPWLCCWIWFPLQSNSSARWDRCSNYFVGCLLESKKKNRKE